MLKISNDQAAVFAKEAERAYEERVADFLRDNFDDAKLRRRQDLLPFVRDQIACASRYGLGSERQVATYVMIAWMLGEDFDRKFPVLRRVLRDGDMDPDRKAELLGEHTARLIGAIAGE